MAISFACETCNKKYKVDEKLAGKRATCKGCGTAMQIPGGEPVRAAAAPRVARAARQAEQAEPDFDALIALVQAEANAPARPPAATPRDSGGSCPDCGATMIRGTRVCVGCGYDVRTGNSLKTKVEAGSASPDESASPGRRSRGSGSGYIGGARGAGTLTIIGILASVYPLTGYHLKVLAPFGESAPLIGCVLGLIGAVIYFLAGNPGAGMLSGGGVVIAFAVCMAVNPYAKARVADAVAAKTAQETRAEELLRQSQADAEARNEARRQEAQKRIDEMRAAAEKQRQEAADRLAQMNGGPRNPLVPAYIPPPPPRQLPSDPVDRDLFLLQSGQRSERITAGAHLLADPPKARLEQVAAAFRGLVDEQDVSLRRQSIPGMLLVGTDENVPALIRLLGDSNVEIRTAAIKVLARLTDERSLEPLLNRLAVDTEETLEAVRPFADRIEPLLMTKLKEGDKDVKLAAAKGLLVFGTPACLPELRTAAKDADAAVATAARATWKKLAPGELDPFTEVMLDLETDRSADAALARLSAMQPDEKRKEAVVAALTPLLQAGGRQVDVSLVAGALVNWQGKEAVPTLLPLLSSGEADRKQKIARALAKTGDPQVATVLVEWMTSNSDRPTAAALLGEMGPAAEDAVLGMLFIDDPQLAPFTLGVLEKVGTAKSQRQLRMFAAKVQTPLLARQAEAAANAIEKRRLAELREQRLHSTTGPTTKKAV